jgi:hypothetical protein
VIQSSPDAAHWKRVAAASGPPSHLATGFTNFEMVVLSAVGGGSRSSSTVSAEACVSAIAAKPRASSTSSAVALSATARAAASRCQSVSRAARSPPSSAVSRSMSVFSSAAARSASLGAPYGFRPHRDAGERHPHRLGRDRAARC